MGQFNQTLLGNDDALDLLGAVERARDQEMVTRVLLGTIENWRNFLHRYDHGLAPRRETQEERNESERIRAEGARHANPHIEPGALEAYLTQLSEFSKSHPLQLVDTGDAEAMSLVAAATVTAACRGYKSPKLGVRVSARLRDYCPTGNECAMFATELRRLTDLPSVAEQFGKAYLSRVDELVAFLQAQSLTPSPGNSEC